MRAWTLLTGAALAAGTAAGVFFLLRRNRARNEIPALISDCEERIRRLHRNLEQLRSER